MSNDLQLASMNAFGQMLTLLDALRKQTHTRLRLPVPSQIICRLVSSPWCIVLSNIITTIRRKLRIDISGRIVRHPHVPRLPALRTLVIRQSYPMALQIEDIGVLAILRSLFHLHLHNTTTFLLSTISCFRDLQRLYFYESTISLDPLVLLKNLTHLSLRYCTITDRVENPAFPLPATLAVVYSYNTNYYSQNPLSIYQGRVQALLVSLQRSIDPRVSRIYGRHIHQLSATLVELVVDYHSDSRQKLTDFSALVNLKFLRLDATPIFTPTELLLPASLRSLQIRGNWILTDTICSSFQNLEELYLSCLVKFHSAGLSAFPKLRRFFIASPTGLHSRTLPDSSQLEILKL